MKQLFEYHIKTDRFYFKYAKGEPAVKGQEFHDYSEFVFFISGSSFLISKNIQQELVPGSIVLIPNENFHQFCVKEPETYTRCILGFRESEELADLSTEIMNKIKVISAPDEKVVNVFEGMIEIAKSELSHKEKVLYIHSSLIQLLIYMKLKPLAAVYDNMNLSPIVRQTLAVIDEKYRDNLTLKKIAEELHVSPSTLEHKFSKELNISVYRYIVKKRLSIAHNLIYHGETLTNAALNSGFRDYSCFYRLYKKYYNH